MEYNEKVINSALLARRSYSVYSIWHKLRAEKKIVMKSDVIKIWLATNWLLTVRVPIKLAYHTNSVQVHRLDTHVHRTVEQAKTQITGHFHTWLSIMWPFTHATHTQSHRIWHSALADLVAAKSCTNWWWFITWYFANDNRDRMKELPCESLFYGLCVTCSIQFHGATRCIETMTAMHPQHILGGYRETMSEIIEMIFHPIRRRR